MLIFTIHRVNYMVTIRRFSCIADAESLGKLIGSKWLIDRELAAVLLNMTIVNQFRKLGGVPGSGDWAFIHWSFDYHWLLLP